MSSFPRIVLVFIIGAAAFVASPSASLAESAIRFFVPAPAGTSADLMARILAEHVGATVGASLVVENKPGASGVIAVESTLQAGASAPVLLVAGLDHILYGPAVLGRRPWDPLVDLKPIGLVNHDRWTIVGHPGTAGDHQALMRTAKERPLRCANSGLGTTQHAVCAWVAKRMGLLVEHIPYSQSYLPDLIAGRVDIAAMPVPGAAAALNGGRVKGVMLLSPQRHPSFASIPTSAELNLPGLVFESGLALYTAPGATDVDVDRLHQALQRAQTDKTVNARFVELGVDAAPATREQAAQHLRSRIRMNDEMRHEALGKSR